MQPTLEIKSQIQDMLVRQAVAHGVEIDSCAASLLERASHTAAGAPPATMAKDMVELFAPLRGLNLDFERDRDPGRGINL